MSIGRRFSLEDISDYDKVLDYISSKNVKYYQRRELRLIKVKLSGLLDMPCDQLKKHLKEELDITCLDVRKLMGTTSLIITISTFSMWKGERKELIKPSCIHQSNGAIIPMKGIALPNVENKENSEIFTHHANHVAFNTS